MKRKLFTEQY